MSSDSISEGYMETDGKAMFKEPGGNEYKMTLRIKHTIKETDNDLSKK
jgi:hypothetical protein